MNAAIWNKGMQEQVWLCEENDCQCVRDKKKKNDHTDKLNLPWFEKEMWNFFFYV